MSKKIYLFSLVLLALAFTACSETEETGKYDNWQARNEAFIDSIANAHANTATRGQLDSIHMIAYPGVPIYFKKKTPVGDGVIQNIIPRATDEVTVYYLKSATKLFSVLLASKRPLITELADKLRLKYPLLPTISPCPTMRLEAIRSIIPISCRRYPKSV